MTMRRNTVLDGASRIRYGTTGRHGAAQDQKAHFNYCYYCCYYLFASSHESIHGRAAEEAGEQAPRPPCSGAAATGPSRSATGPGRQAGQRQDSFFFPSLLAGEPYKVALTCKGPSERAEELGCSLPISIPSRLVVLPSPFLEVVVSSHVVWCASLRCAVLFAQDESMKRDECSWMETDGVASRLPSSRLSLPSFALLPTPLALQRRSPSYRWTRYCTG